MSRRRIGVRRSPRLRRARSRGFTLTELMAVVVIMGVLAALSIRAFRERALQSNVTNAEAVIKAIAVAEEHYRAENQVYLDVSSSGDTGWYPHKTIPVNQKWSFWRAPPDGSSDPETTRWQTLAPDVRQMVEFAFKANAGLPDKTPTLDTTKIQLPPNVAVEPWYVIQARADANGDGVPCMIAAASWSPQVISVDDGE